MAECFVGMDIRLVIQSDNMLRYVPACPAFKPCTRSSHVRGSHPVILVTFPPSPLRRPCLTCTQDVSVPVAPVTIDTTRDHPLSFHPIRRTVVSYVWGSVSFKVPSWPVGRKTHVVPCMDRTNGMVLWMVPIPSMARSERKPGGMDLSQSTERYTIRRTMRKAISHLSTDRPAWNGRSWSFVPSTKQVQTSN